MQWASISYCLRSNRVVLPSVAGIVLNSLHDMAIIESDLVKEAAARIGAAMKWPTMDDVNTAAELLVVLERRAAEEIERRVDGLVIQSLRNVDAVVA